MENVATEAVNEVTGYWDQFINFIRELATTMGLKLLGGLIILFVGLKLSSLIVKWAGNIKGLTHLDKSIQSFLKSFLKIVLYAIVISSTLMLWGVPTSSFITMFASAGVAIGLALQGALSNFAGGLMILMFRPFKVGDFIENGAIAGTVTDITVIYTILTTPDNKIVTIPNGSLTNSNIINYSTKDIRRVDIPISVSYTDDIEKVRNILLDLANSHELVIKDDPEHAPMARLCEHGSNSIDFAFRVWVNSCDFWTVKFDLLEQSKNAFDAAGVSIPFPQLDVHMKND